MSKDDVFIYDHLGLVRLTRLRSRVFVILAVIGGILLVASLSRSTLLPSEFTASASVGVRSATASGRLATQSRAGHAWYFTPAFGRDAMHRGSKGLFYDSWRYYGVPLEMKERPDDYLAPPGSTWAGMEKLSGFQLHWNGTLTRYSAHRTSAHGHPTLYVWRTSIALLLGHCMLGLVFAMYAREQLAAITARRRIARNECPTCGYTASDKFTRCPECGAGPIATAA